MALAERRFASLGQCCVDERPMIGVEAAVSAATSCWSNRCSRPAPVAGRDLEHDR